MFDQNHLQQLRADTPGTKDWAHLNNAGAALMPLPVIGAMIEQIQLEASIGGYEAAARKKKEVSRFYEETARLLNTRSNNIAFAYNATDAYNRALSAIPFSKGDLILTSDDDYVSNQIAFLQLKKKVGVAIVRAASKPEGGVDPQSVRELTEKLNPKLVAITHVPTSSGLVQDVYEIGRMCAEKDILYLVDGCQSAGQMPLDVQQMHCDFLSATMRKFLRGPRGGGFLYVSDKVLKLGLEPLYMDLQSADWTTPDDYRTMDSARRFELWEKSYATVLGSVEAIAYANTLNMGSIEERVKMLAHYCREQMTRLESVSVRDKGSQLCGIVSASVAGSSMEELKKHLHDAGINFSFTYKSSALIDFQQKGIEWTLRISPHYYNTMEELDQLISALEELP